MLDIPPPRDVGAIAARLNGRTGHWTCPLFLHKKMSDCTKETVGSDPKAARSYLDHLKRQHTHAWRDDALSDKAGRTSDFRTIQNIVIRGLQNEDDGVVVTNGYGMFLVRRAWDCILIHPTATNTQIAKARAEGRLLLNVDTEFRMTVGSMKQLSTVSPLVADVKKQGSDCKTIVGGSDQNSAANDEELTTKKVGGVKTGTRKPRTKKRAAIKTEVEEDDEKVVCDLTKDDSDIEEVTEEVTGEVTGEVNIDLDVDHVSDFSSMTTEQRAAVVILVELQYAAADRRFHAAKSARTTRRRTLTGRVNATIGTAAKKETNGEVGTVTRKRTRELNNIFTTPVEEAAPEMKKRKVERGGSEVSSALEAAEESCMEEDDEEEKPKKSMKIRLRLPENEDEEM